MFLVRAGLRLDVHNTPQGAANVSGAAPKVNPPKLGHAMVHTTRKSYGEGHASSRAEPFALM